MFPAGSLPELRTLELCVQLPAGPATAATAFKGWGSHLFDDSADFSLLSCCPGLQSLVPAALESAGLRFCIDLLDPLLTHLKQLTQLLYDVTQHMGEDGDEERCHMKFFCEVSFQISVS
jgi:hypothetical protein